MLGMTCHHVGEFLMQSAYVYRGAWILAIAPVAFGLWRMIRAGRAEVAR